MKLSEPKTTLNNAIEIVSKIVEKYQSGEKIYPVELKPLVDAFDQLNDVYESLDFYDQHPLYISMDTCMRTMKANHSEIDGYTIKINLKPSPARSALIEYNFFGNKEDNI